MGKGNTLGNVWKSMYVILGINGPLWESNGKMDDAETSIH
jgi:hypothetical protein